MKKLLSTILIISITLIFAGCQKEITKSDFLIFSKECLAENYYNTCFSFLEDDKCRYYYNLDDDFIFKTYTMALIYSCNSDEFKQIKNDIKNNFDTYIIAEDAEIAEKIYEIYYAEDDNRQYSEYKEFGFISLSEDKDEIRFYWFYDQDYDGSVFSKKSFEEFYELMFDWLKEVK